MVIKKGVVTARGVRTMRVNAGRMPTAWSSKVFDPASGAVMSKVFGVQDFDATGYLPLKLKVTTNGIVTQESTWRWK